MAKGTRGGKRGEQITGATVSKDGQSVDYYFQRVNGVSYFSRGINDVPEPIPGNMTKEQLLKRAADNGSTVKSISPTEIRNRQEQYKKERAETDAILNRSMRDRDFVKGSRMQRIADRQRKRRR